MGWAAPSKLFASSASSISSRTPLFLSWASRFSRITPILLIRDQRPMHLTQLLPYMQGSTLQMRVVTHFRRTVYLVTHCNALSRLVNQARLIVLGQVILL